METSPMNTLTTVLAALLVALALVACGESSSKTDKADSGAASTSLSAESALEPFLVAEAPADAIPATDVRQHGVADADVVVEGRCDEFVDGFAVFTIVDLAVDF
jgi:hypothetical protein